jgi:haloalkane dehalogenase
MHDWGGAIGMGFAARHPEDVKRLVIFNTAAFLSTHIPWRIDICRRSLLGPIAIRMFNVFARGVLAFGIARKERLSDQVRAGYLAPYDSFKNRVGNLRFVQDIPMTPDIPSYPIMQNIETNLHKFRDRPTMIVWGKKDFCFNDHFLRKWCDYFPDAEVHEVRDAGHLVVEDAHEKIIPWMRRFLENNSFSG